MEPPGGVFGFTGDVDTTPLLAFTGGALVITQPLAVSSVAAPDGASMSFGPSVFTGPVFVGLEGFEPNPPADDPRGGIALNAMSVSQGMQVDTLFVSDESSRTWCFLAPTGSYVEDLTIRGTLYGPSGAYQTRGDTGPTGANSTVAGPAGPTGANSTVPGPTGPTGANSTVAGPAGPAGASSTVPGPTGPTGGSQPAWVLGRVNAGASTMSHQSGIHTGTAARIGIGNYTLSWPTTGVATSYVQLTCAAANNNPRFVNYLSLTATGMSVFITNMTGGSVDSDFNVRVDAPGA